uniref:Peptidase S1 domain-containing protein n=1 Tax=Megaselia scalaris TaxID=36166 RepID=T1GDM2_MEGSC
MIQFLLILIIFNSAFGRSAPNSTAKLDVDDRIYRGKKVEIVEFPYVVSILENNKQECGGSLYKKDIVITAAHCLWEILSLEKLKVRLGSSKHNSGGVIKKVKSFKVHPKYNPITHEYDIGVIHLESPVELTTSIQTIELAKSQPTAGSTATVVGWGSTEKNEYPAQIRAVVLKTISNSECASKSYKYGSDILDNMI